MIHLLLKGTHKLLIVISAFLLLACSSHPTNVQLQPELSLAQSAPKLNSQLAWNIRSQDLRIAHYIIEINSGDNAATLINESQSSHLAIKNTLHQHWIKQGLNFTTARTNKIDIQLIKLLAQVEQNIFTHTIDANIIVKVKLSSTNSVFSKTFKSHATQKGIFSADSEKLAKELNAQLSQLLDEIVQDPELNVKLQQL